MSKMYENISECDFLIREKTVLIQEVALILGSGLGKNARSWEC